MPNILPASAIQTLGVAEIQGDPSAATVRPKWVHARLIKAEANLLRFPIFALSTKGLKNVDQIQCVGTKRVGTEEHRFSLTVSRNTRFVYPGPLARKVHFALLSTLYEQGYPFRNPIGFTWRDLARRMGVAHAGNKISRLKEAIRSIHGIVISTEYAPLVDGVEFLAHDHILIQAIGRCHATPFLAARHVNCDADGRTVSLQPVR